MKKTIRVLIEGEVHGVFFRANTAQQAQRLGVAGWVRNTPRGVEAVFEGDAAAVDELVEWCRRGPDSARVQKVKTTAQPFKAEYDDFQIIY